MKESIKFGLIIFPFYFSGYNVSERVIDANNDLIKNVAVNFIGGYSAVYTDSEGYWVKTGLGGTVTICAQKTGYTFTPTEYTVKKEKNNINFKTEETILYNIGEKVTNAQDNPLSGIRINFSDKFEPAFTGTEGNWSKTGLRGKITVTPEDNYYSFEPESRDVIGDNSYVDFTAVVE